MAKLTVQQLIMQRFDRLEEKVDKISTEKLPAILVDVATLVQKGKSEASSSSTMRDIIWGGITLLISLAGVAVAYFKN